MRTVISHPSQPAPLNLMLLAQNDHKNMFCSNQVKKLQQLKIWDWLFASPWDKFAPLFFLFDITNRQDSKEKAESSMKASDNVAGATSFQNIFCSQLSHKLNSVRSMLLEKRQRFLHSSPSKPECHISITASWSRGWSNPADGCRVTSLRPDN